MYIQLYYMVRIYSIHCIVSLNDPTMEEKKITVTAVNHFELKRMCTLNNVVGCERTKRQRKQSYK